MDSVALRKDQGDAEPARHHCKFGAPVPDVRLTTKEKTALHRAVFSILVTEPQVRIELTTARLRIGCSTPELLWPVVGNALERTRTAMPFGTTPSRWRVYQFHHQGKQHFFNRALDRSSVRDHSEKTNGADGARTRDLSSDSRVL